MDFLPGTIVVGHAWLLSRRRWATTYGSLHMGHASSAFGIYKLPKSQSEEESISCCFVLGWKQSAPDCANLSWRPLRSMQTFMARVIPCRPDNIGRKSGEPAVTLQDSRTSNTSSNLAWTVSKMSAVNITVANGRQ